MPMSFGSGLPSFKFQLYGHVQLFILLEPQFPCLRHLLYWEMRLKLNEILYVTPRRAPSSRGLFTSCERKVVFMKGWSSRARPIYGNIYSNFIITDLLILCLTVIQVDLASYLQGVKKCQIISITQPSWYKDIRVKYMAIIQEKNNSWT